MKKIICCLVILLIGSLGFFILMNNNDKKESKTKIKVAEVTHSVFYAPWYVALEKGYFEDEGLNIEVILTPGADKVSAAVLSNDVEIGFCGAESSIYVYNGGEKDYIQDFAGLTKRDGQFIVSREKIKDFSIKDMMGKEVLVGRKGGMPALNFENALFNNDIDSKELNLNYSVEFAALSGAFIGGTGDFVNLFEPTATKLEKEGYGYVVASVGELSGEVPYTVFNARKSYIKDNKKTIQKFVNAINKGLSYVQKNDSKTIAKTIIKQFPDTSLNDMITIVDRYKEADSWLKNSFITEDSFKNLEDIMIRNKNITDYVPYEKLINNSFND